MYDLFFRRTKGKIFVEGETQIDYDIKYEEENYKKHKKYNLEELQKIMGFGEKIEDKNEVLKLSKYSIIKEGKLFQVSG